ncbi:MAG: hypothetical protein GX557_12525 [Chloroflexi bacterium]|nr:hypothetical protein [Chloroflexota bacterium]
MTTAEERVQILRMVEARRISPEEAAKLLEALEHASQEDDVRDKGKAAQWFRVKVTDLSTGRTKVNVNIPIGLVNVGMRMGAKFAPGIDSSAFADVLASAKSGQRGKILEVDDHDSGEHVEIYTE